MIKGSITLLLILLGITQPLLLKAQQSDSESYEADLEKGIDAFYQTEWDRADQLFTDLKEEDPEDPRAFFFHSMIPFWEYFFGGNSAESARVFLERSEKAIEISEQQLSDNPHDTTMVLMLSGLYGYRSLVAASEKEYRTAVQSGMTGYKFTRQLLSIDDEDPKALIGKGIFYYMLGNVPDEAQWVTNLAGMKGDKQEGLDLLEQAASDDSYVSNDAKMILTYLYREEGDVEKALGHIKDLRDEYQQNVIFHFNYAELLEESDRPSEARDVYQTVVELQNSNLKELQEKSRSKLESL